MRFNRKKMVQKQVLLAPLEESITILPLFIQVDCTRSYPKKNL